jgi:copper resistance protein B
MRFTNAQQWSCLLGGLYLLTLSLQAAAKDDPLLSMLSIDHFEVAPGRYDALQTVGGECWAGYDFHKAVLSWDIEREDGDISESEWGVLYRTVLSPFWDVDIGLKKDFKGTPSRSWGLISVSGTAPYYFEITADLMISNEGRWGASFEVEQEWMMTQQWVVKPSVELDFYAKEDEANEIGSGLSSLTWAMLLGYEVVREFTPYIGVRHFQRYGDTAQFVRHEGEPSSETLMVVGFEAWL